MVLPVDPLALSRVLRERGLPPPVEVRALGTPRALGSFLLRFGAGAPTERLVLRVVMADTGEDPLAHEQAAIRTASTLLELPLPAGYTLLPAPALGRRAALCGYIEGQTGTALLDGSRFADALGAVGRTLAALDALPQPGFGARATAEGGFAPRRGSWREEIEARLWSSYGRAKAAGTDLGPLSARLMDQALAHLPALDEVRAFGLVHGDLHPGNLMFRVGAEGAALVGVLDWEHALLGDPLMDWALALQLAPEALAGVIRGYGAERAEALRNPGARARSQVYVASRALHGLAFAALPLHDANQGRQRALLLERARQRVSDALEGRHDQHLDRAFDHLASPAWRVTPLPPSWAVLGRRALERLREGPEADAGDLLRVAGALAAALRGAAGLGTERDLIRAELALPPRAPDAVALHGAPIADRAAWRTALVDRVLQGCGQETPTQTGSLTLTALALIFLHQINEGASDEVLRGLESAAHTLLFRERRTLGSLSPAEALAHGLLGLWALDRLAPYASAPPDREALERQADDARLDLILSGAPAASEVGALLPALLLALDGSPGEADSTLASLGLLRTPA